MVPYLSYRTIDGFVGHMKVQYLSYRTIDTSVDHTKVSYLLFRTIDSSVDHKKVPHVSTEPLIHPWTIQRFRIFLTESLIVPCTI